MRTLNLPVCRKLIDNFSSPAKYTVLKTVVRQLSIEKPLQIIYAKKKPTFVVVVVFRFVRSCMSHDLNHVSAIQAGMPA